MKKLYLKLSTQGLYSLGLDIVWENVNFQFLEHQDLGVFDELACNLQDDFQGRLVISAANLSKRHVSGEHEFIELRFGWADGESDERVEFAAENVSATNMDDEPVPIQVFTKDYEPDGSVIEFIWR